MERITQKERLELEEVFKAIYTKKESKILKFYKEFYSITTINFKNLVSKIRFNTKKPN